MAIERLRRVVRCLRCRAGATGVDSGSSATGCRGGAHAVRERARRIAAVTDPRLLPVYGQGEEDDVLWLATRQLAGSALAETGTLDKERAARLGSQVARQLVAMQEAAIAPDSVTADDLVVEGAGDQERAWLLPNPTGQRARMSR